MSELKIPVVVEVTRKRDFSNVSSILVETCLSICAVALTVKLCLWVIS